MKKTALLAAVILLSASLGFAQSGATGSSGASANGDDKYFHFGLNITPGLYFSSPGTSASNISNSPNGAAFGFGYGINLEFYFTHNYGIATGLEVTQFGTNYTSVATYKDSKNANITDSVITSQHTQTMQYLELPLLLKLRTNSIGLIKYFGEFGLGTSFLLSAKDNQVITRELYTVSSTETSNNVDIYKQSDFIRLSLVVGLGLEYNLSGSTSIQGALTYDNAFTNVNSDGNNSILAKGVNLTIGVLF